MGQGWSRYHSEGSQIGERVEPWQIQCERRLEVTGIREGGGMVGSDSAVSAAVFQSLGGLGGQGRTQNFQARLSAFQISASLLLSRRPWETSLLSLSFNTFNIPHLYTGHSVSLAQLL